MTIQEEDCLCSSCLRGFLCSKGKRIKHRNHVKREIAKDLAEHRYQSSVPGRGERGLMQHHIEALTNFLYERGYRKHE